jgi:prolyl-tRNA synthetase
MRFSQLFFYTLREEPQEAEVISHKLMLKAGLIRKLSSGVYTFLPLGFRVLKKVENIVREEMNKIGAQEILMPALHPQQLWEETGRDKTMGDILMRISDRQGKKFFLGSTHEEVVTDLVRNVVKSYRQLPFILYQIQTKFRDEPRPRFGIIRAKEFIMKDAYSFERNEEELNESYNKMYQAYCNIFKRCGLKFKVVEAFSGAIGGEVSHEFIAISENGEDVIVFCENCEYSVSLEKAEGEIIEEEKEIEMLPLEKISTPNIKTVEELTSFLKIPPSSLVKTLIYKTEKGIVVALVRGDYEINETKLKNVLKVENLEMAEPETIERISGAKLGFAGPVNLKEKVKIVSDEGILKLRNFVSGANETDFHLKGINYGRDFKADIVADIKIVKGGERCPGCKKGNLKLARGIELGHIFKLGNLYSLKMSAHFLNENGEKIPIVMGCYGIGVTRIIPAIIEQNYDRDGIIWPVEVAPYKIVIIQINANDRLQTEVAERIYKKLIDSKIDVIFDDRRERAGVKFKDADLIGFPIKIIVGEKVKDNKIELKFRRNSDIIEVGENKILEKIKEVEKQL